MGWEWKVIRETGRPCPWWEGKKINVLEHERQGERAQFVLKPLVSVPCLHTLENHWMFSVRWSNNGNGGISLLLQRAVWKSVAFSISKGAVVIGKLSGSVLQFPLCGGGQNSRILPLTCELWHTATSGAESHGDVLLHFFLAL